MTPQGWSRLTAAICLTSQSKGRVITPGVWGFGQQQFLLCQEEEEGALGGGGTL